ncbi:hypothetical protein [Bacteroides intestinalis]|jgi:flagellar basal body-associated protein FliL|uniref:DUF4834 family protein n=1 Tax=Bacteroides intestinalis TaxID=329854 RepID=A0A415N0V2_9BACE|nr:hypothetical protein [Bacteroides intestinalis]RHL88489.1 hypothetical protein DWZ95_18795 [Bacteroides intestinalis]
MEAGDYLLVIVLIVLVVVGLIINPVIAIAFVFFLFMRGSVKKQETENKSNAKYYRDVIQAKRDARIAKELEKNRNIKK